MTRVRRSVAMCRPIPHAHGDEPDYHAQDEALVTGEVLRKDKRTHCVRGYAGTKLRAMLKRAGADDRELFLSTRFIASTTTDVKKARETMKRLRAAK